MEQIVWLSNEVSIPCRTTSTIAIIALDKKLLLLSSLDAFSIAAILQIPGIDKEI
jgi:hypothetical protein